MMKKEFAKWILDIAKYIVTALLLSSVFSDMSRPLVIIMGLFAALLCLGWGLWILKQCDKDQIKEDKK
jgi:hypothetical protein